jgi:hypothetical protein
VTTPTRASTSLASSASGVTPVTNCASTERTPRPAWSSSGTGRSHAAVRHVCRDTYPASSSASADALTTSPRQHVHRRGDGAQQHPETWRDIQRMRDRGSYGEGRWM